MLAGVACLSAFHFSRMFKRIMGEPLYQFIKRLRLEKAAGLLLANRGITVTEIALMCGFATSSAFAKSFRKHFKMSATKWRQTALAGFDKTSTPVQIDHGRIAIINGSPVWAFVKDESIRQVLIEEISPVKVAYIRNVGPYEGDDLLFQKLSAQLFRWAAPRGQLDDDTCVFNIYHDNPEITDAPNLRVMVAIPLLKAEKPSGSVGITKMSGGKYAICRFFLKNGEFGDAWHWMSSAWLPDSGYEWDDRESFERCYGEKTIDGSRVFDVDIGIPVRIKSYR